MNQGFTLVELLLYIALAAVILLGVSSLLAILLQSQIKNQVIAEVEQEGLQVMQLITQTVRNAEYINSPATSTTAASLSLGMSTASANPTVFNLVGAVIKIKEGSGPPLVPVNLTGARVIASNLNFHNLSRAGTPGTVRIEFQLTHNNPEGRTEYDYKKSFYGSASLRQP